MSITFPMWFIYFWAVAIFIGFINAVVNTFRFGKKLNKLSEDIAKIMAPKIAESLSDSLSVSLNNKLSNEYIVVKKPVRKVKKEETENA